MIAIVQVQLHDSLVAEVQVLDQRDLPLPAEYFSVMSLRPHLDPLSSRYIKVSPLVNADSHTARYEVKGAELGTARLQFSVRSQYNDLVRSNKVDVQV